MKTRPVYTLSEDTLFHSDLALRYRLRLAWQQYEYLRGTERAEQRKCVRNLIAAIRQLQGYQKAKIKLSARRYVMRRVPKFIRKRLKQERRRRLKEARRQNFRPSKAEQRKETNAS